MSLNKTVLGWSTKHSYFKFPTASTKSDPGVIVSSGYKNNNKQGRPDRRQ